VKKKNFIEATVKFFNDVIQWACWTATAEHVETLKAYDYPILIKWGRNEEEKNSVETVNDYEQKAKDYLKQQHKLKKLLKRLFPNISARSYTNRFH
jgi:hypothetical protein